MDDGRQNEAATAVASGGEDLDPAQSLAASPASTDAAPARAGASRAAAEAEPGEDADTEPLFCPVARALDLIGARWVLVLLRHLLGGARSFRERRARTGIAPRVLSTRLRELLERDFIAQVQVGNRSLYALTPRGESLEPVVREIARWWVTHEMGQTGPFSNRSPASVVESLPFLLRADRAQGVQAVYELRLTGEGGGVWTIEIDGGVCRVREGFADQADVRYTADAREWCRVALGRLDDRGAAASGRLKKDGVGGSLAWYFHQPAHSVPGLDPVLGAAPLRDEPRGAAVKEAKEGTAR